jgi:CDP-diglyceride synthetase
MSIVKKIIVLAVTISVFLPAQKAKADAGREFLMSVTYGTLAGALLGTASLAFTDKPGDKLQRIARGASLGLYFGILLGLYVIYAVPDESDELKNILPEDDYGFKMRAPMIYPTFADNGKLDGAAVDFTIFKF